MTTLTDRERRAEVATRSAIRAVGRLAAVTAAHVSLIELGVPIDERGRQALQAARWDALAALGALQDAVFGPEAVPAEAILSWQSAYLSEGPEGLN